jgi:Binding-prot-dependent transport system membrane comp, N-term/Binding-protein-dependent transport system inner membrane component
VWQYIVKRVLLMIPTLVGAALVVFLLMNVVPGDIALVILGTDQGGDLDLQAVATLREQLGLNRPLHEQFLAWLWGIVRFDFGVSLWSGAPVMEELMIRLPLTVEVALLATLVSTLIAIPLGTLAAIRQNTWIDYLVRVISIGGLAIPSFWTGILLILFLVIYFEWGPPLVFVPFWEDPWENFKQLVWPIVTVGYRNAAVSARSEVPRSTTGRTSPASGHSPAKACSVAGTLREFLQQRLRLLEVCRVKALGKPAVDGGQQLAGFSPLTLALPQPAQAQGRPQLPGFGLLVARYSEGLLEAGFRLHLMVRRARQE